MVKLLFYPETGPDWVLCPGVLPYMAMFLVSWSIPPVSAIGAWPSGKLESWSEREPGKSSGGVPPYLSRSSSLWPGQATGLAAQGASMVGILLVPPEMLRKSVCGETKYCTQRIGELRFIRPDNLGE